MDEERNIVQTVLKANNTFKDFSLSRSLCFVPSQHTHTHKPFSFSGKVKVALSRTTTTGSRRSTRETVGRGKKKKKKGTFSGFMEMRSGERLLGRKALEQSGTCVLGRDGTGRGWEGFLIPAMKTEKTTSGPVNRRCVFLDWAGEGSRFTGIRQQY